MTEHEDTETCGNTRACLEHDTTGHWRDDYAYASPNAVPKVSMSFDDMITLLKDSEHLNPEMRVYRFALVVTDEDGKLDVFSYPSPDPFALINLLTKCTSLIAFQEHQAQIEHQIAMRAAMSSAFTGAIPMFRPPAYADADYDESADDTGYSGGNLYP